MPIIAKVGKMLLCWQARPVAEVLSRAVAQQWWAGAFWCSLARRQQKNYSDRNQWLGVSEYGTLDDSFQVIKL